jgi:L-ribulose-5-phosphate 4-epimerase
VVICQRFRQRDPDAVPAVLVAGHGPFCWGTTAAAAAHHAVILESVARIAYATLNKAGESLPIGRALHDKHFLRKHGQDAYYGQVKTK